MSPICSIYVNSIQPRVDRVKLVHTHMVDWIWLKNSSTQSMHIRP